MTPITPTKKLLPYPTQLRVADATCARFRMLWNAAYVAISGYRDAGVRATYAKAILERSPTLPEISRIPHGGREVCKLRAAYAKVFRVRPALANQDFPPEFVEHILDGQADQAIYVRLDQVLGWWYALFGEALLCRFQRLVYHYAVIVPERDNTTLGRNGDAQA